MPSAPRPNRLRAGAGRAVLALPASLLPIEGFTRVLDDLETRVILIEAASGERVAVVVADQTSLPTDAHDRIREIVSSECALPGPRILVTVSHTFSAPHILPTATSQGSTDAANSRLIDALETAVRAAAREAAGSLRPATLAVGEGYCDVQVNRDVVTGDGWWLGANDLGPSLKHVPVVALRDDDERVIAVLFSAAVQPSVINGSVDIEGGRAVSADLAGAASRHVERIHPGSVAAFLVGAAADQAPRFTAVRSIVGPDGAWAEQDAGPAAEVLIGLQGERLGAEVARVVGAFDAGDADPVVALLRAHADVQRQVAPPREQLHPSLDYTFQTTDRTNTPIVALRLGDAVLAGVVPEITSTTAVQLRDSSPFAVTALLTMVDGADKYMADEDSFDRLTYEAMSSRYARGSAEVVRDRLAGLLAELFEK